jgi:hypothetical protein
MGYYKNLSLSNKWKPKKNRFGASDFDLEISLEGDMGLSAKYLRGQNMEALNAFNAKVQAWGSKVKESLTTSIQTLVEKDVNLSKSLKNNYYTGKGNDEIERIGFGFRPEGVYIHLGVGKGYHRLSGETHRITKTNTFKERRPILWFNPVVEQHLEELSKIVEEYSSDLVLNYTRIFINS